MQRSTFLVSTLSTWTLAAACSHSGRHHHDGPPPPPVYSEREPNDSPFAADFLGGIDSHSHFFVEGHVEHHGYDIYDHFELVAEEALTVHFWLEGFAPYADVDLCLVDPDTGEVVACYDSPWNTESGSFTVDWPGKRFVLLVETWEQDTSYRLELSGGAYAYGPAASGESAASGLRADAPSPQKEAHQGLVLTRRPAPAQRLD